MVRFQQILFLLLIPSFAWGQQHISKVVHTLYLVGDSGEPTIVNQPLGKILSQHIKQSGENSTLLYLGDNIYPSGMPPGSTKSRALAEEIITTQAEWIKGLDAMGIFIPGNHDLATG